MELTGVQKQAQAVLSISHLNPQGQGEKSTRKDATYIVAAKPPPAPLVDQQREMKEHSAEKLQKMVEEIKEEVREANSVDNRIQFSIDDNLGRIIVKVIDRETEEVVRQIPPEEFLKVARNLRNFALTSIGMVLDEKG